MFVLIGLAFAIGLIGWFLWQQARTDEKVALFPRAKLLEKDLGRMQVAFGDAGLNDYEFRNGQVHVPRSQRDRYLKALSTHDALPESSREMYEPEAQSPWATLQQQQESNLLRKKKMIRQLVLQLDFVADAVVDYDELDQASWPPVTKRSAAVVIHPKDGRLLESFQIDAIRSTICGSVAGLTPADIVITDSAAGHAYTAAPSSDKSNDATSLQRLERAKLEQRIRDGLTQFGHGIEAYVNFEDGLRISAAPVAATNSTTPRASSSTDDDHPATPIANRPATIAVPKTNGSPEITGSDASDAANIQRTLVVRIHVPAQCVRDFDQSSTGSQATSDELERPFRILESRIKSVVQPLLAAASLGAVHHHIDVALMREPLSATSNQPSAASSLAAGSKYFPQAALGAAGVVVLLFLARRPRSVHVRQDEQHRISSDRLPRDSSPLRSASDSIPDETRRKLQKMVDDDPDQAAEIIKQWIRDAA
jgi:flagellar biosynthesis/type III secretory pathway M-ring protein FliF/YscJ